MSLVASTIGPWNYDAGNATIIVWKENVFTQKYNSVSLEIRFNSKIKSACTVGSMQRASVPTTTPRGVELR